MAVVSVDGVEVVDGLSPVDGEMDFKRIFEVVEVVGQVGVELFHDGFEFVPVVDAWFGVVEGVEGSVSELKDGVIGLFWGDGFEEIVEVGSHDFNLFVVVLTGG